MFCDARSVRPEEGRALHVVSYAGTGVTFEALAVMAPDDPPRHRWYACCDLQVDEVVAFRTDDTQLGIVWKGLLHAAHGVPRPTS